MIKPLKKLWKRVTRSENTVVDRPKAPSQAPAIKAKPGREFQKQKQRKKTAAHKRPRPKEWDPQSFQVPVAEGKTRFHDLGLPDAIIHAIADLGFQYCTPIQAEILPSTLKGKDATGRAQTGTGKTAAFLITVLALMLRKPSGAKRKTGTPRVLVIAPTRELVLQIAEEAQALCKYTSITTTSVFGGMDYEKQRRRLNNKRTDIVVATPGRLLDFKRRKDVDLSQVEVMIIDEADRMLDMGFIPDVRKIIYSTPHKSKRQTLLFSATLTPEVTRLTEQWTRHPVTVEIEPEQVAVDSVNQLVYIVTSEEKNALLYNIVTRKNLERVIVFCNRKDETRRLAEVLEGRAINCAILSGDVRQHKRIRTLEDFKSGKIRVLVATDVAGRGIHIEGMDHVINYTLPRDPEDYVHRIGRTGRAGAAGTSISFADEDDSFHIPAIEALLGNELPCIYPEDEWLAPLPPASKRPGKSNKQYATSHRKANPRNKRGGRPQRGRRPPRGRTPAKPRSGKRPS